MSCEECATLQATLSATAQREEEVNKWNDELRFQLREIRAQQKEDYARATQATADVARMRGALEEAIEWSESAQGRSIPQVDGQPGRWINHARAALQPPGAGGEEQP